MQTGFQGDFMHTFTKIFYAALLSSMLSLASSAHAQAAEPSTGRSSSQVVNYILNIQERRVIEMAEVMPAGKYSFAPAGGGFQGVRTFADQLRHIAADNYLLAAGMLGEKPPVDVGSGESGSDSVRTKSEIIDYLKASFVYMHRAVALIDDENIPIPTPQISPWPKGTATRLGLALEDCVHTWDHYGQLAVYLRMNAIIPPESRK
jgi:hypothetical protein